MDTVPAFPVRDMPIALHFAPVQLSQKIGYHCPGEHGLSGKVTQKSGFYAEDTVCSPRYRAHVINSLWWQKMRAWSVMKSRRLNISSSLLCLYSSPIPL